MRLLAVAAFCPTMEQLCERRQVGGYCVSRAQTGAGGLYLGRDNYVSVKALSPQLSDLKSTEVSRLLQDVPVIAASPLQQVGPRVAALAAGADDVVTLPMDATELRERLRAVCRRGRCSSQQVLSIDPGSVSIETHDVLVAGRSVHLSMKEAAVLELFMLRRGRPLTKETFLHLLYSNAAHEPDAKIIDLSICSSESSAGSWRRRERRT